MSIPKIIHLCWFGRGKYPLLTEKCIESWKKFLPDYEIKIWNEESFDISCSRFTKLAYDRKKWAFVSDYVRLKVLYEHGGIYMDTDLEVIKDFSSLLRGRRYVSSRVEGELITCGFIACEPRHPFIKAIIDYYDDFYSNDSNSRLVMNPIIFTKIAQSIYDFPLCHDIFDNGDITIFPLCYFMPYKKNMFGRDPYNHKKYHITSNTYTIHHDMGSWARKRKWKRFVVQTVRLLTPERVYLKIKQVKSEKLLDAENIVNEGK